MDEPGIFIPLWLIIRTAQVLIVCGAFAAGHYFGRRFERARSGQPREKLVLVAPVEQADDSTAGDYAERVLPVSPDNVAVNGLPQPKPKPLGNAAIMPGTFR